MNQVKRMVTFWTAIFIAMVAFMFFYWIGHSGMTIAREETQIREYTNQDDAILAATAENDEANLFVEPDYPYVELDSEGMAIGY